MVRLTGFVAALVLAGASPAWAQSSSAGSSQEPAQDRLDDVVVYGESLETRARAFVEEVAEPAPRRGLARWDGPVCFGVVNFRIEVARQLADGLASRADALGLPVADPDCRPNVIIVGTVEAAEMARAWVARSPRLFRPGHSGAGAGRSDLEHFTSSNAAVRWWHVSMPMHYDVFQGMSQPAVRLPGGAPPRLRVYSRSQHASRIRDDLLNVMILVDVDRLDSVTVDQLCDYLLMVAYAQIDPQGDTSTFDTVLNLFDNPAVPGLTDWDRSYLSALYESDPTRRVTGGDQGRGLAGELRRNSPGGGEAEPGR